MAHDASRHRVSVIDTRRGIVTETIQTALFTLAPEGRTADALAIALDGTVYKNFGHPAFLSAPSRGSSKPESQCMMLSAI
jgi:hypothetical protein